MACSYPSGLEYLYKQCSHTPTHYDSIVLCLIMFGSFQYTLSTASLTMMWLDILSNGVVQLLTISQI